MGRILIVDDDRRILQLLGDCFKDVYTVETAMNGGEALTTIRRQRPDVVLLDIMLPGVSGIHLLREIKRLDPTIAVIMVTGSDSAALAAEALANGAARLITKPFNLRDLDQVVAELVSKEPGHAQPE